ncbi:MAG TPA: OB-fold domain-containing protein [Sphingopyxis sp.]|nr:OB-fold domain-containing protein [Sphingopyxis sp.]HMP45519.1 OB-fold domain-containing protein [Sphingopyxis sp.]HMQ18559.1 OB-fold domain-containing protein [Sphingopyxis sp.]
MTARTLPVIDRDNEAFWTWGREGKLAIHRCGTCEYFVHPPVPFCPRCESRDVAPQAVSGRGRIVTFTVNHKAWVPDLPAPYVLALVAIEEQDDVRIPCNIVGCDAEAVDFGMEVEVTFEAVEDLWVPLFRPVRT